MPLTIETSCQMKSIGSDFENNEPPYPELGRTFMLCMLNKINQKESVAPLYKVLVQPVVLYAQPYGNIDELQPPTELTNKCLMP